jgi:hypothetical protein
MVLLELGPVVLILPDPAPPPKPLAEPEPEPFETPKLLLLVLVLRASPLLALPPKVLPELVADPVEDPCELLWRADKLLLFEMSVVRLWLLETLLNEPGPVVLIVAAEAKPLIPIQPAVKADALMTLRRVNLFI